MTRVFVYVIRCVNVSWRQNILAFTVKRSLVDPNPYNVSPRLFHFTSASGTFEAVENLNTCRNFDLNTPFPFYQSDLYKASQPGENFHSVDIWGILEFKCWDEG